MKIFLTFEDDFSTYHPPVRAFDTRANALAYLRASIAETWAVHSLLAPIPVPDDPQEAIDAFNRAMEGDDVGGCHIEEAELCAALCTPSDTCPSVLSPATTEQPPNEEKLRQLDAAARPLMEWLRSNWHPHVTVIVDSERAELVEGLLCVRREPHPEKVAP